MVDTKDTTTTTFELTLTKGQVQSIKQVAGSMSIQDFILDATMGQVGYVSGLDEWHDIEFSKEHKELSST